MWRLMTQKLPIASTFFRLQLLSTSERKYPLCMMVSVVILPMWHLSLLCHWCLCLDVIIKCDFMSCSIKINQRNNFAFYEILCVLLHLCFHQSCPFNWDCFAQVTFLMRRRCSSGSPHRMCLRSRMRLKKWTGKC